MSAYNYLSVVFLVACAASSGDAIGQVGKAANDPADPKAAVPPVRYESAFARYRPNAETEVGSWRERNDNVGRIGGWRVYGREAIAEPKPGDKPAGGATSSSEGEPKPHHGHKREGAK